MSQLGFRLTVALGLILIGVSAGLAPAQSIGINFVANSGSGIQETSGDSLGVDEVAGAPGYAQDNWNNLGRWGSNITLSKFSNKVTFTGVTIVCAWDSPNIWNDGAGTSTPNCKLMHGYIDAPGKPNDDVTTPYQFWTGNITTANVPQVFVKGLAAWLAAQPGATGYSVVIYSDGDATEGRRSEYWVQETTSTAMPPDSLGSVLTPHVFLQDSVNFTAAAPVFTQVPITANTLETAGIGNYIVFTGLTADQIIIRSEEQTFRSQINAVQIIATYPPSTVTIAAGTSAAEPATEGTFTVTRAGGDTSKALDVYYNFDGTATAGTDFATLSGMVTIPVNESTATITVTPIDDGEVEVDETVTVALTTAPTYELGEPSNAQINLISEDVTATITVEATDSAAAEVAGNTGTFTFTRTGSTLFPLTLNYTVSGTATGGADYAYLGGKVVIPAGQASVAVPVTPYEDGTTEGDETVMVTITSNDPQYVAGAPDSATATIADNGSWSHWTKSLDLVFAGYTGTEILTEFPVLVVLTPERVNNYAGFNADGSDLRFRSGDLSLPYEVEKWDPAGSSYVWVKVPQIAAPTDAITLVWGNTNSVLAQGGEAVWTPDYLGVWHLNTTTAEGLYYDSTGHGNDGTNYGASPVEGAIGGALSFDAASSNYVDTGNTENITYFTVMTYVRGTAAASEGATATGPVHRESNYQINWGHGTPEFNGAIAVNSTAGGWRGATMNPLEANTWYCLAGTYDGAAEAGGSLKGFRDGVLITQNTEALGIPEVETNTLKFARHAAAAQYFSGTIDEVQVLSVAKSESWVANQAASMVDNLIAFGGVVAQVQLVAADAAATELGDTGTFTLTRSGGNTSRPLTVYLTVEGTATPGKDYTALPIPVTFAGGETQINLTVSAIQDWLPLEGEETVILTLQERAIYDVAGEASATVTIQDIDSIADWKNSMRVSFSGYMGATPLAEFPVLVTLTPDKVDNYAGFAADGSDIRFTNKDQTALLPYEIERWDAAGTSLIWVKVPQLDQATTVWMHWNNPGVPAGQDAEGVWTAGYLAVYHFADEATVIDSTANDHDGTIYNSTSATGRLGLGRGFNGTDAYVDLNASFLSNLAEFTVSGWIAPEAAAFGDRMPLFGQNDLIEFGFHGGANLQAWVSAGGTWPGINVPYAYNTGEWHYVVMTGNATSLVIYLDGVEAGQVALENITNQGSSGDTAKIGTGVIDAIGADTNGWYSGLVDEIRFSGVARSAEWVAAEYAAMTGGLSACAAPRLDLDTDGDVDQVDFGLFQACFTGTVAPLTGSVCACADTNGDGYVAAEDLAAFQNCYAGPAIAADAGCLDMPQ
ncbi:MAG: DUF2341 domain-containing protein [Phycisphaerae bacterium]|nr:DUF2341 domain-containing protein [Phycisphaerae bacterium]